MLAMLWLGFTSVLLQDEPSPRADETLDAAFVRLLEAARKDPSKTDWKALRLAYSKTKQYNPDAERVDPEPILQELKNGERAAAFVAVDRMMAGHWVDPEAHLYAADASERVKDKSREDLHVAFARGLHSALISSGDGRSFETAYHVLFIAEEYYILDGVVRLKHTGQALTVHEGHYFDIHTVETQGGDTVKIYFNIDIPWHARKVRVQGLFEEDSKP